jgi:hypothetical protein
MDEALSKEIALRLVAARSVEDVHAILKDDRASYYFGDAQNWSPYGNREKNWDTVGNQSSNPIGALVEILTNGIDAILLRKAREAGISDYRSAEAPQSMFEAVKRFFPHVVEGKIQRLEPKQRTELAQKCIQVAVQRAHRKNHQYPTYTMIDAGDGQLPEHFSRTFLSLSEKNKEGIPFVQGKFNMGSTGSLRFCTRGDIRLGHFKFIVSRPPGQPFWGWTIVRVRGPKAGEALPVAEYFHINRASIQKFRAESISAFGSDLVGSVQDGTIVKLYEYDIGPDARSVDFGLYNALTVNLIDCALPIQLYDFDATPVKGKGALREQGIAARTFGGLNVVLRAEMPDMEPNIVPELAANKAATTEWVHLVEEMKDEELGRIKIVATAVSKLQEFLSKQPARVFYSINGQTHAFERASFLNTRVGLPDLRNHVLINVICDEMNKQAMATIFMPDRERKADTVLARLLERRVIDALKGDDKLRSYAAEIRRRRASEHIEDKEETADLLRQLVKADPAIRDLFGLGAFLPEIDKGAGGDEPFPGKKFPTFLRPLNLREENGSFIKELPTNATRRIECGTDAENEYLTRVDSPGESWCSLDESLMPHSVKLRNGTARFTLVAPKTAKVGDIFEVEFGFQDQSRPEPMTFRVTVRYTEPEEAQSKDSGKSTNSKPQEKFAVGQPNFQWVRESEWTEHTFDQDSGAYVSTGDATVVYVNSDNRYLRAMRVREKDEGACLLSENMFKMGLGLFALALHRKAVAVDGEQGADPEQFTRQATLALAPYVVTIIRRLGGGSST